MTSSRSSRRPTPADLPVGVPGPGFLPGRPDPFYNKSRRAYLVAVGTYKWTSKLTQAMETAHVFDPEILGYGSNPYVPRTASYHGLANWFLYQITPKVTGVWRSEIFWDPYGLATGNADTYHEITLGLSVQTERSHLDTARGPVRLGAVHAPVQRWDPQQPVDHGLRRHLPVLNGMERTGGIRFKVAGRGGRARRRRTKR